MILKSYFIDRLETDFFEGFIWEKRITVPYENIADLL